MQIRQLSFMRWLLVALLSVFTMVGAYAQNATNWPASSPICILVNTCQVMVRHYSADGTFNSFGLVRMLNKTYTYQIRFPSDILARLDKDGLQSTFNYVADGNSARIDEFTFNAFKYKTQDGAVIEWINISPVIREKLKTEMLKSLALTLQYYQQILLRAEQTGGIRGQTRGSGSFIPESNGVGPGTGNASGGGLGGWTYGSSGGSSGGFSMQP